MSERNPKETRTDGGSVTRSLPGSLLLSKISIDPETRCWNWTGVRNEKGYGLIQIDRLWKKAHRVSFEEHNGPIPDGLGVLHRCDNRPCINPEHLFVGTNADNVADMVAKGRTARGNRQRRPVKISDGDVIAIRAAGTGVLHRELAAQYGVSTTQISYIRSGRSRAHLMLPSTQDIEIGRKILRDWCRDNDLAIEPVAASDLVQKIAETIAPMNDLLASQEGR